jgi:hypothetical protein
MANRNAYPSMNGGLGRFYLDFLFTLNGAASPSGTNGLGTIDGCSPTFFASIVRTGTGVLVVTMADSWNRLVACPADVDDTPNDGAYATVGNVTNEATSTPLVFTIRTRAAAGALTDYSARTCRVSLALRNTTAGK